MTVLISPRNNAKLINAELMHITQTCLNKQHVRLIFVFFFFCRICCLQTSDKCKRQRDGQEREKDAKNGEEIEMTPSLLTYPLRERPNHPVLYKGFLNHQYLYFHQCTYFAASSLHLCVWM